MRILALICISIVFVFHSLPASGEEVEPCMTCEELKNLRLPDINIDKATIINPENDTVKGSSNQRSHCKVTGIIGREIKFELLLPLHWNGRFVMGGGGGFVGYVMNRAASMVHAGFATVGTDTGHEGTDASWALNNLERQVNFGHLAVHRTAVVAKSLIYYFYCHNPEYSYFIGLSRGGGQAMMEAQRYPADFDGIVAGAPAFDWVGMAIEFIQNTRITYPESGDMSNPVISQDNLQLLERRILAQCDAMDGLADSILTDPRDCDFDLASIPDCPDDRAGSGCLTSDQRHAIKTVYDGFTGNDHIIHPGFPLGGENEKSGWQNCIVGPNRNAKFSSWQAFYGIETFRYLIFNDPDWDYSSYDLSSVYQDTRYASAYLDATNTNYSAFKKRGGKMILYQGWIDPLISALDIIRHYEMAEKLDPNLSDYIRLFMLPGVTHTGGKGPGKADWFSLIQDWVENDRVPERVVASKYVDGKVVMTRPLFPYPDKAIYVGAGDPNEESNFKKK